MPTLNAKVGTLRFAHLVRDLQDLLRRPADRRFASSNHDRPLDQDRVRDQQRDQRIVVELAILKAELGVKRFAFAHDASALSPSFLRMAFSSAADGGVFRYSTTLGFSPRASMSFSVSRDFEQRGL